MPFAWTMHAILNAIKFKRAEGFNRMFFPCLTQKAQWIQWEKELFFSTWPEKFAQIINYKGKGNPFCQCLIGQTLCVFCCSSVGMELSFFSDVSHIKRTTMARKGFHWLTDCLLCGWLIDSIDVFVFKHSIIADINTKKPPTTTKKV